MACLGKAASFLPRQGPFLEGLSRRVQLRAQSVPGLILSIYS